MQTVKRSWLLLLNFGFVALDITFYVAYFLFRQLEVSESVVKFWGITPIILGICGIHMVYVIFFYPWFSKRNLWFSTVVSFGLIGMLFSSVIETSGGYNYYYRAGYVTYVFLMGMGGIFAPIAAIILTWLIYLFTLTSVLQPTIQAIWLYTLINCFVTAGGALGWLIFKRFYIKNKDAETIALSKLLEQEQFKANVMLESISDGVMVINTKGTVQVLNESAATMLGWTKDEALKLDYRSLLGTVDDSTQPSNKNNAAEIIKNCLASKKAAQGVVLLQTKNNRQVFVDIVASPILETPGLKSTGEEAETSKQLVGIIAVLRDVDEQKRQEQQRSDFISTASHEMRTPVASIQGFIELALNPKVTTIDEKAKGYLEKAHEATKHLGELFQDLLTVSKSDDGRLTNHPQVIEIGELLKELVEANKMAAENKQLKVVFEGGDSADKSISPLMYAHVDPERLREVVINLFDNAIKYTSTGMITVGASLKEQSIVIRVSDTGMGIAEEDIPHLFQKFYRTDNTATREIGGTGLGLYICRQIIEMMGGKIWVESTVGAGSTFYVEIPRVDPSAVTAA